LEEQFDRIRELNSTKGVEYSGHADVLSDFREVAEAVGVTQEQALITYATKHWRAINAFVQTGAVKSEPIEGRLQDLILYSLLLIAMEREKDEDPHVHPRWQSHDQSVAAATGDVPGYRIQNRSRYVKVDDVDLTFRHQD
jgi:hypothetical protein